MNKLWKHNLNVTVTTVSLQNFNLESFNLKFYWGLVLGIWRNTNGERYFYFEMPNVKGDGTKHNSNWNQQTGDK